VGSVRGRSKTHHVDPRTLRRFSFVIRYDRRIRLI